MNIFEFFQQFHLSFFSWEVLFWVTLVLQWLRK